MLFHSLNLLAAGLGIPTKPCMRNPLISSSLRDFWARRWNLPTSESLRITCYEPLVSILAPSTSASGNTHDNAKPGADSVSPEQPATQHPSSATVSQRRTEPTSSNNGITNAPLEKKQRSRSPRQQWAAFAGLCLAFFLSGLVHHWLISLFTKMDIHADYRFAILFYIQPILIAAQEAWIRSGWWKSVVKVKAPAAAWCAFASTSLVAVRTACPVESKSCPLIPSALKRSSVLQRTICVRHHFDVSCGSANLQAPLRCAPVA